MAGRKTKTITITDEGRDKGKVYSLTELPASKAERWAMRAFFAMMRGGVTVPDDLAAMGMAGLAQMGLSAVSSMSFHDAEPLLDEMMTCVKAVPDPTKPSFVRELVETDIEEVKTRLLLRKEVFTLHTDFFTSASPSA